MSTTPDERDSSARREPAGGRLVADLASLSPAYFGMVMATGIVSLAVHMLTMPGIAQALFGLNVVVYSVLWLLTVLRMARYPRRFFGDMVDHLREPGFFTTVLLIINAPDAPFLLSLLSFIKGFTVFYWATGTWWIPMLVVLALWRHVYRRFPMKYDPLYWGAVFPLGMYAASTHEMIAAMGIDFLGFLPPVFLHSALAAWTAAFIGFAFDLLRRVATFRS